MKMEMPMQPYLVLLSEGYQRIEVSEMGISHFYEFQVKNSSPCPFNAVPDGSIDLLFNIGEDGTVCTYLSGTVFKVKGWTVGNSNTCFGVRFQPGKGVLPRGFSMDMIVDNDLEIDGSVYGESLPEQIAEAGNIVERAKLFLAAYRKLLLRKTKQDIKQNVNVYVQDRIRTLGGNITMECLSEETGYSACYLRRIFKQYNGISPKQFAQYIRFQNLLHRIDGKKTDYAGMAVLCGYYDEPHMMKEFKTYTGVTMQQYGSMIEKKQGLL